MTCFLGLSFAANSCIIFCMRQMSRLEALILTLKLLRRVVCYNLMFWFTSGCMPKACESYRTILPLRECILNFVIKICSFRLLECFNIFSVSKVLDLARKFEVVYHKKKYFEWYSGDCGKSIVIRVLEYIGVN